MDSETELPTPKKEDVLFAGDQTIWKMDAILDFRPGNDYTYRQGYRRAGRILTEYVASHGEVDFLVFPICHAYRHHVELSLKRLILLACNLADRALTQAEEKLQNGSHNLADLWETSKPSTSRQRPRPASPLHRRSTRMELKRIFINFMP